MEKIIFKPQALYSGSAGLEVLAGAELSPDEIQTLLKAAISPDHFTSVFLICEGGHRQRLSTEQLEKVLAEPLVAYRAILAQEAAEAAEAMEKAAQEADAQRAAQEAAILAAQKAEEDAKKLQFQSAIG